VKVLERFQTVFLIAGVGFFLLSFVGMGVAPWTTLKDLEPPEGMEPRSALAERGRQIFMQEGCWHCHTQFVRPSGEEPRRYGPPPMAMEHVDELPQLYGTRRVGQDLSRVAGKYSDDWHLAHFYNPRTVVPWSVMPGFPWLYEEQADETVVPTEDAKALVAYVQSIGRAVQPEMEARERTYRENFRISTPPPATRSLRDRGEQLFQRECIGCHGALGDGVGDAADFLQPLPADLTVVDPKPAYVFEVLSLGIPGTSMPHFRQYHEQDRWAIAMYVPELSDPPSPPQAAPAPTTALVDTGRTLFGAQCATCHGSSGGGDGPVAPGLTPRPADFHRLRPSAVRIADALENGVPGTAMPPFAHLDERQRWALAYAIMDMVETEAAQQ